MTDNMNLFLNVEPTGVSVDDSCSSHSFPSLSHSFRKKAADRSLPEIPEPSVAEAPSSEQPSQLLPPSAQHPARRPSSENSSKKRQFFKPIIAQLSEFCRTQSVQIFVENENLLFAQIALAALRRKLNLKIAHMPETYSAICTALLQLPVSNLGECSKRIEENNKFVFKHTLKLMKHNFNSRSQEAASKNDTEELFLRHYFYKGDECILDPSVLAFLKSMQQSSKALSHGFYQAVFTSEIFYRDFVEVVTGPSVETSEFTRTYMDSIYRKLLKLFRRWQPLIVDNDIPEDRHAAIFIYFQNNKQCKLPWTLQEICSAIRGFLKLVKSLFLHASGTSHYAPTVN